MSIIKELNFDHADNKSIVDYFGFYNHSSILDHIDSKQMFAINLRFTLNHDNKINI